jgi:hypothetical protein
MKTVALALMLGVAAIQQKGEERPRVPEDSVELSVSGCLKGRVLNVSDEREVGTQRGPIVKSRSFRLAGNGDIMKDVKKMDGHFVEVVGIVKRSALDDRGVTVGRRIAVGGGSPVASTRSMPDPAANVAVMDISSLVHRSTSCAVK